VINYHFRNPGLMQQALTHRSVLQETGEGRSHSNEQLELLGDAVLDLIVVEYLYRSFPDRQEGELSKMKSRVVSGHSLQKIARTMDLGKFILMSENEARNGGRERDSILEDTIEAIVAAIYLDGGQKAAQKFITKFIMPTIDNIVDLDVDDNYKSQLLEYAQAMNWKSPSYIVINESGPDHAKEFDVEVMVRGESLGRGIGNSKKAAQQEAAKNALKELDT
jgi:ribonuclease III